MNKPLPLLPKEGRGVVCQVVIYLNHKPHPTSPWKGEEAARFPLLPKEGRGVVCQSV
ncbi:hypothetical protein KKA13_04195 [Patescibacteria group bacterium]|nr:hypothetical protein [Patescibacteria group bacterium]